MQRKTWINQLMMAISEGWDNVGAIHLLIYFFSAFKENSDDDLEEWDGRRGREAQERGDTCTHTADSCRVYQKLTQHRKAILLP